MSLPEQPIESEYHSPGHRILDRLRDAEAVRAGRHPGSERELIAVDDTGNALVIAFQFDNFWHVDIETRALTLVGIKILSSEVTRGFRVRTEAEAVDWLEFLARAVTR